MVSVLVEGVGYSAPYSYEQELVVEAVSSNGKALGGGNEYTIFGKGFPGDPKLLDIRITPELGCEVTGSKATEVTCMSTKPTMTDTFEENVKVTVAVLETEEETADRKGGDLKLFDWGDEETKGLKGCAKDCVKGEATFDLTMEDFPLVTAVTPAILPVGGGTLVISGDGFHHANGSITGGNSIITVESDYGVQVWLAHQSPH